MKRTLKAIVLTSLVVLLVTGVSQAGDIVKEKASDHSHRFLNAKNAGEYHVNHFMNQRTEKIGIQILDRFEEVQYLELERIRAEVTQEDGTTIKVWLYGENFDDPQGMEEATTFSTRFDWVKEVHKATLRVWVPMPDGNTYELTFDCDAYESAPTHSGL